MRIGDAIGKGVESVTKEWSQYRIKQIKDAERAERYLDRQWRRIPERSIKDIAYEIMEEAYMKASGNGRLPALARQIMYQARPLILAKTSKTLGKDFDQYFTQNLLPSYINERSVDWNVVYDARGNLIEKHTGVKVPIGTLDVHAYLRRANNGHIEKGEFSSVPQLALGYSTAGPRNRYKNILFIEKEGFLPLFEQTRILDRYDLALMSTKGLASTAARQLIEELGSGIKIFVLHDFDKSGFSILGTLKYSTWRYKYKTRPQVIDLGLRLDDVIEEKLQSERVSYREKDPRQNLFDNGATVEEIEYLVDGKQRVELNAFASDQFIDWLERKLKKHKVEKIIPPKDVLEDAYREANYSHHFNKIIKEEAARIRKAIVAVKPPANLETKIREILKKDPPVSWDQANARIVREQNRKGQK